MTSAPLIMIGILRPIAFTAGQVQPAKEISRDSNTEAKF